jgi:hypothetical protein
MTITRTSPHHRACTYPRCHALFDPSTAGRVDAFGGYDTGWYWAVGRPAGICADVHDHTLYLTAPVPHPAGSLQIQITFGPVCEASEEYAEYMCGHWTCELIAEERAHYRNSECPDNDDAAVDLTFCPRHWTWAAQDEAASWTSDGFAGGGIFHGEWTCGCVDHDESRDVAAAM